jgi:hypothetical protein
MHEYDWFDVGNEDPKESLQELNKPHYRNEGPISDDHNPLDYYIDKLLGTPLRAEENYIISTRNIQIQSSNGA